MARVRSKIRLLAKAPGVPEARHVTERAVAPYLRADVHQLGLDHSLTVGRLSALELKVQALVDSVAAIELHQPTILNSIASTNGTARLLARQVSELHDVVKAQSITSASVDSQISGVIASLEGIAQ